jgi:hypothetical protein
VAEERQLCSHGRIIELQEFVWIGIQHDQWPVCAFSSAEVAARWVGDSPKVRHAYKIAATPLGEVRYVPPIAASFEEVEFDDGS